MALIELRDITKTYILDELEVPVLRGVSLDIRHGEYVALMGVSGSGKTTLMNLLGCLDRPTSGKYILDGHDVTALSPDERASLRNRKIGFVFQNFNLLPRTTARDNVAMPLSYSEKRRGNRDVPARAEEVLTLVGLGDRLGHEPSQLSGGQQQRVAIARALVNNPPILFADEPTGNLDSKTSEEVMEIFRRLNEEDGVTIILVTHDEHVAKCARRIIKIKDGVIVGEEGETPAMEVDADSETPTVKPVFGKVSLGFRRTMQIALNGLRRNVLRAALTALGIVIGVGAVIAMMEIGRGSSTAIQATISSMGANTLAILPGTASSGGVTFGAGSIMTLTPQDSDAVASECPAVKATAPIVRARVQLIYGNRNWVPTYIYGTTPSFLDVREWPMEQGDVFSDRDVRNGGKVCLLGKRVVRELFQDESPIGKEVRVQNVPFKVMGVLSSKGANMMGMDQDDIILAPWTTIKYRVAGTSLANTNQSASSSTSSSAGTDTVNSLSKLYPTTGSSLYPQPSTTQTADTPLPVRFANVDQILAAAYSSEEIPAASKQISRLLRERHRVRSDEPEDFNIRDMAEITRALSSTATLMTKLLLVVALISLVVGGVGIMNIMLVSVMERTREIGLRLAVGARAQNILRQFLMEAVALCFFGGAAGVLLGRGASQLVRVFLGWPTELSPDAIVAAFVVSASVGIIFGYYPAWKASKLDPILALRYE